MDTKRGSGCGINWDVGIDIYTILCIKWAFQVAPVVKNPPVNAGDVRDVGLIPGLGRSPVEGHGNPLQYCCLENPKDIGSWQATVDRVAQSDMTEATEHTCIK